MIRKNFFKSIFALIIFLLSLTAVSAAEFSVKIEKNPEGTFTPKSEVRIPISIEKITGYNFSKPFKLELDYNHNIFGFKKLECNSPFSEKDFKIKENDLSLTISNFPKRIDITFKDREFPLGNIVLFVKDSAPRGQYSVSSKFYLWNKLVHESSAQINVSSNGNSSLPPEIIKNQKNKSGCKLKSITPEIGSLSTSFDPNIFEYTINVDENIRYLELKAEPQESDASVKISRRKLETAGNTTTIRITVSNRKDKTIYIVKVNRADKTDSKSGSKNSKGSNKSEKSSKKGTRKKKSLQYGDEFDDDDDDLDNEEENDNNSENEIIKNENNNQKIYLIIILSTVMLVVIGYFTYEFIKYKRKNSKNTKNSLNKPLK